jgi:hypothetical protein
MKRTTRVLLAVAWFAAISLFVSPPPTQAVSNTGPQPGPCFYYNGVFFCP